VVNQTEINNDIISMIIIINMNNNFGKKVIRCTFMLLLILVSVVSN